MQLYNMPMPILEGESVRLRAITEHDTNNIVRWRNNPQVAKNFIYRAPFTYEGHMHWLKTKVKTGNVIQYIIEQKHLGHDVGSVYLRDIDYINNSAEYGIFIGEDTARGQGIGTEAARLFLQFALGQVGLHRVFLRVFANNAAAISSYKKVGFVTEGVFHDMVYLDGKYHDIQFMAVIQGA